MKKPNAEASAAGPTAVEQMSSEQVGCLRILLLGLGQSLRGDDGVGLAAVGHWRDAYPRTAYDPCIRVELAELPGLELLDLLEGTDVAILVDALKSQDPPGTIHVLDEKQLAAFSCGSASAHGWSMGETLTLGRHLAPESLPDRIVLVGIAIEQIEMGAGLSPAVQAAIPRAVEWIERQVARMVPGG